MQLNYVDIGSPGYTRRRLGDTWEYLTDKGKPVRSAKTIDRLNSLALPPAYRNASFARDLNAHLQATGIDDKGRKQYRYHPAFIAAREAEKYGACISFGASLPKIRAQVEQDLARRDLSRERVIAAIVRLLDLGSIRIGNASYARANRSFGATTLRSRHAKIRGSKLMLDYVGKSGKAHSISIADPRLISVVRRCQDLPGQSLFQFVDDDGSPRDITSADVNEYLAAYSGNFTAKHFRTWAASVLAFEYLAQRDARPKLKDMLAIVSEKLGNTPAIARKSYVHPALIDAVEAGLSGTIKLPRAANKLSRAERGFIAFLSQLPETLKANHR